MVDVNIRTPQRADRQLSERKKHQLERIARRKANRPPSSVRVVPANEDLRRVLKHPNGMAFLAEGGAEWPNDRFTKRRLADGGVTLEGGPPKQKRGSRPRDDEPKGAA
jgi:hypothetical protein